MRCAATMACLLFWPTLLSAASTPSIDGFVNDDFWATGARSWRLRNDRLPDNEARFNLGYDSDYLYFSADVDDPNVVGRQKGRKTPVWEDDGVKLLLHFGDPAAGSWTAETFSYAFSAFGGVNWARGPADIDDGQFIDPGWPVAWYSNLEWAARLKAGTTPNLSSDRDAGYVIEGRIPWSELGQKPPFPPGHTIGICLLNICRPEMTTIDGHALTSAPGIHAMIPAEPGRWQRLRMGWQGPLALRGLIEPLPLPSAAGDDEGERESFGATVTDPTGPWLDRARWREKLELMRSRNLNTLVLRHPDPLAALQRHAEQFTWLLAEATRNSVRVYLQPTGLESQGRETIRALFVSYPYLAGLSVSAKEMPAAAAVPIIEGIVGGMQDALGQRTDGGDATPPELLLDPRGLSPQETRAIVDAYPHVRLLHRLQDGQWLKPAADAFAADYAAAVDALAEHPGADPVSAIAAGTLGGALKYLFWGDPEWMRDLTLDVRRRGLEGLLLDLDTAEPWLARDALGDYAYNAGEHYSPQRWLARLQEKYGIGDYAGQLLETMQHASAIVPRFVTLVHDDSPRYMPQFGLPLTHYVELPSISTRPTGEPLDPAGVDWGERVAPIRADVRNTAPAGSTRPHDVVRDLRQHVDTCRSRLTALRHLEVTDPARARDLAALLDRLELNVALGEHFRHKIDAAVAWEQFQARRARGVDCLRPLEKSVAAWREVVQLARRIYPDPLPCWQSRMVSVPPWSAAQLHRGDHPARDHWRDQLPRFEREAILIREYTSTLGREAFLPLWDHIQSVPQDGISSAYRIDFESDTTACRLFEGVSLTTDKTLKILGKQSLLIMTQGSGESPHLALRTEPKYVPLSGGMKYQITLGYRVVDNGGFDADDADAVEPFEIGLQPADGEKWVGQTCTWTAPTGHVGVRTLQVSPPAGGTYSFCIAVRPPAAIVIDPIDFAVIPAPVPASK